MRSLDRLAEGDGDELQPDVPGTPSLGCVGGAGPPPDPGQPGTKSRPRRRRHGDTSEQRRPVEPEPARAARTPAPGSTPPGRRRRSFDDSLKGLREAARFADNVRALFGGYSATAMSDVSLTRLQQLLTERLSPPDEEVNAVRLEIDDLAKLSKTVESAIAARHRLEQIRRDFEEVRGVVTPDAGAGSGTDGRSVVDRVKQLLGVPLGPETPEEAAAARQFVPFDPAQLENSSPKPDPPTESRAGAAVAPGL